MNPAAGADAAFRANIRERINAGVFSNRRREIDKSSCVDAVAGRLRLTMQMPDNGHKGTQGIRDPDQRQAIPGKGRRDHGGRSPAAVQEMCVLVGFHEGNVALFRRADRPGRLYDQVRIAQSLPLDQFREFLKGDTHARSSFLP